MMAAIIGLVVKMEYKMKITIEFDNTTLEAALTEYFTNGTRVQDYIIAAINYFGIMRAAEEKGNKCGYGDNSRFSTYNTEISPNKMLENYKS